MTQLSEFIDALKDRDIFPRGSSVTVTRAPGRLDVMGGIADYSGSLVLQRPIAEATFVALEVIEHSVFEIVSIGRKPLHLTLDSLAPDGEPVEYEQARRRFSNKEDHWAAYVAGVLLVLMRDHHVAFSQGAKIVIWSTVPEGKGVSSSAALETAVMQAVVRAYGLTLSPVETALLSQKAENLVAGAPCGVMDQMTCVFGEPDSLMALLCQPTDLQAPVGIPEDLSLWGIDSGERHAVSGADYTSVRTGAFMGYSLIASRGDHWDGYLANIAPEEFERDFPQLLPDEMSGADFIGRGLTVRDTVTRVDPLRTYKVRQPAAHPIYENQRVEMFREILLASPKEQERIRLGELMFESHSSYSACGLGSHGTDLIVRMVREQGAVSGLYGARITGGGSGGTVAVLGRQDAQPAIDNIARQYENLTGHLPYIFSGSSPGIVRWGSLKVTL